MNRDLVSLVAAGKRAFTESDLAGAEQILREALEKGANYADLHYLLGRICHRRGKMREAVEHFQASAAINPAYTEALLSLAITLSDLGRYEEARAAYRRAADAAANRGVSAGGQILQGRIANLHAELGDLYHALGQHEEAVAEYRKAVAVAPDYPDLRLRLAAVLREAGRTAEGLAEIERVLAGRPDLAAAHLQRGLLLYLAGDQDGARRAWEEALNLDPGEKLARFYLNALEREERR